MHGTMVPRPVQVGGAPAPEIFRAERYGNFEYRIPAAAGRYIVTLHFAETWFGPGQPGGGGAGSRIFDVNCNGLALLRSFDVLRARAEIIAHSSGRFTASLRTRKERSCFHSSRCSTTRL